jgi:hypothetical protein
MLFPNNWPDIGYIYIKDQFKILAWAIKDKCPGQEQ